MLNGLFGSYKIPVPPTLRFRASFRGTSKIFEAASMQEVVPIVHRHVTGGGNPALAEKLVWDATPSVRHITQYCPVVKKYIFVKPQPFTFDMSGAANRYTIEMET
jgi:hypothetical protein